MFKKFLLASSVFALTTSVAFANAAPYLGGGVGIIVNTTTSDNNVPSQPGFFRGLPVNIFAGYGGVISQNFYLAGEVFGTVGTAEISSSNSSVRSSYSYGASLLPGLMLSDHTFAFVRAGVVRTSFVSRSQTGGQAGIGLQTSVTQNIDVRGEYDFTAYGSFDGVGAPRSDASNIAVVYKFD